jgi:DNA-binding transcriptional MocR family regulator
MPLSRKDLIALIRERITSGAWPPGARLPTTGRLAAALGVGESMVNQAMATLIDSGEIVSVPGGFRYVTGEPRGERTVDISDL